MLVSLLSVWPVARRGWQRFQFRRNKKTVHSVRPWVTRKTIEQSLSADRIPDNARPLVKRFPSVAKIYQTYDKDKHYGCGAAPSWAGEA
jgi:hypothetical protein